MFRKHYTLVIILLIELTESSFWKIQTNFALVYCYFDPHFEPPPLNIYFDWKTVAKTNFLPMYINPNQCWAHVSQFNGDISIGFKWPFEFDTF